MFNLIISIIAIALVVVLAGASLYYGGDAFNKGSESAKASTYINQAQQVQAAATLFKSANGGFPTNLAALTTGGYMASAPKLPTGTGSWEVDPTVGVAHVSQVVSASAKTGITLNICNSVNDNGAGVVSCVVKGADLATTVSAGKQIDLDAAPTSTTANTATDVTVFMKL
jgi:hypothetical protein